MIITTTSTSTIPPVVKALFWLGFAGLFVGFIWLFKDILTPFVLGIAIAYLLDPLVKRFSRKRVPRGVTALVILILFFTLLTLLFILIAPMAFRQAQMLIEQIPSYAQNMLDYLNPYLTWLQNKVGEDYIEQINSYIKGNAGKLVGVTGGIVGGLAAGGKVVAEFASTLVIAPLVAFFMMKEWPKIVRWVEGLYPRQHAGLIHNLMSQIDTKISGFIRGQITVAFTLGVIFALALTIAGLNYGFLIGIMAGFLSIIPLVGSTIGLLTSVTVAWFQTGDPVYTGIIAAIFLSGQFIEGNVLAPKMVGDSVGLHPLWILFALLAGGSLFGIAGMLIAVPVTATIGVLLGFAIHQYKTSQLYLREPEAVQASSIILEDLGNGS